MQVSTYVPWVDNGACVVVCSSNLSMHNSYISCRSKVHLRIWQPCMTVSTYNVCGYIESRCTYLRIYFSRQVN